MSAIAREVEERTPRGIATTIARLITSGDLAPGDRLPTVRDLAADLGVSPATVSHAWQTLAGAGLITSRGRSGSFVRSPPREWLPRRYRRLESGPGGSTDARLDLSRGTPDPELLPPLGPALTRLSGRADTLSYQAKPDIPELHDLLRETWPSAVESITVTNGALDAIDRALASLARLGDRIVLEDPTFPPFLDLVELYGLDPIAVPVDSEGLEPEAFERALSRGPALVLLQPRAHNPTGASMSPERAAILAGMLRRSRAAARTLVIEDDHSGLISSAPEVSLASWLPDRVLHVRSFSKSHGPDLRIGALGGPRPLVDRVVARRLLGPGWTSRMIQALLHELLGDPVARTHIDAARVAYAQRQTALAEALTRHGLTTPARDGINIWLEVADERSAMVQLAAAGIRVAPGAPFQPGSGEAAPRVRVTAGAVRPENADDVASALVTAVGATVGGSAAERAGGDRSDRDATSAPAAAPGNR